MIEVDRDFDRFDGLLGLHTWSKFLSMPSEEEKDKSSKIFYCTYYTGRQVEKSGPSAYRSTLLPLLTFGRLEAREHRGTLVQRVDRQQCVSGAYMSCIHSHDYLQSHISIIRHPYPKTSYCDVPSEAKTGAPMCRPLPQRTFPVPPPQPAPVRKCSIPHFFWILFLTTNAKAGSAEWLAARNANGSASPAPSSAGKGRKAAPSDTASLASTGSRNTKSKSFSPPPAPSPAPSSVMANYRAKNDSSCTCCHKRFQANAHVSLLYTFTGRRGPPSVSSVASAATSRAPSTAGGSSARPSRSAAAPPTPPGLGNRFTSQSHTPGRFDWSEDVEQFESEQRNNRPVRSPASSISAAPAWRQSFDPNGPIEPSRDYEYTEEDQPRHSTVAAMTDIFEDDYVPPAACGVRSGKGGTRPPGIDDPDYDPWNPPEDIAPPSCDQSEAGEPATHWPGYEEPRLDPPTKVKKVDPDWTCSQHGSLCSYGICKERASHERAKRQQKEREKREKEKLEREVARAKKALAKEKKKDAALDERSGSSSSSSDSDTSRDEGTGFLWLPHTHN